MIIYFCVLAFILGTCIGSFSNVCIFRWLKNESVIFKPSHCLTCGNPIKWYDNIPIISYILLHGKCRNCSSKISIQYPIVEFVTGLIYLFIFYNYGFSWVTLQLMFVSWMFVVATVTDIKQEEIPDEVSIAGLCFIPFMLLSGTISWQLILLGFFFPSIILLIIATIIESLTKIDTVIGGGDIKFLFAIGGIMGPFISLAVLFLGCLSLSIIFFPLIIKDYKEKTQSRVKMMIGFAIAWIFILICKAYNLEFLFLN